MNSQQEKKFDDLCALVHEMHGDMKAYKVTQENQRESILACAKDIVAQDEIITGIVADKNKIVGVSWIGAVLATVTGIGALIMSLINKH